MANADGSLSEQAMAYYVERARGGMGVIMMGIVNVEYLRGSALPCQIRLDRIASVYS